MSYHNPFLCTNNLGFYEVHNAFGCDLEGTHRWSHVYSLVKQRLASCLPLKAHGGMVGRRRRRRLSYEYFYLGGKNLRKKPSEAIPRWRLFQKKHPTTLGGWEPDQPFPFRIGRCLERQGLETEHNYSPSLERDTQVYRVPAGTWIKYRYEGLMHLVFKDLTMNGPGSGETILLNRILNWGRHSLPRWVRNWCHTGVTCSTFSFFMLPSQLCSFHIHLQYATSISLVGARLGKVSESFIFRIEFVPSEFKLWDSTSAHFGVIFLEKITQSNTLNMMVFCKEFIIFHELMSLSSRSI